MEARTMRVSTAATTTLEPFKYPSQTQFAEDARWLLAQRIVASKRFAKSSFLTNFLLYVCDRELQGKADEITEYQIGIQALGRPKTYNPGIDNVVRNYARLLRDRLEEYYETEGNQECLRLCIPRGGYVPIFQSCEISGASPPVPALVPQLSARTAVCQADSPRWTATLVEQSTSLLRRSLLMSLACIGTLAFGYLGLRASHQIRPTPSQQLWIQVFDRNRETLIVPADSGVGILQNLTKHPVPLRDYAAGTYLTDFNSLPGVDARSVQDIRTQRYTSMVDLNIALSLSRISAIAPNLSSIRYARDLRLEDIKHANAILVGSVHTNPWDELFQNNLNFTLEYHPDVNESEVRNLHPLRSETAIYKNAWADDRQRTYSVLALVPSLDGTGYVILLEGLNMAGTQAAADFLLNPQALNPLLLKAQRPDGTIPPFELLLETSSFGGNAPEARVIAERYGTGQTSLH